MDQRFLVALDLDSLDSLPRQGLSLETVFSLRRVYIRANSATLPSARSFIETYFNRIMIFCDVTALSKLEDIISLLDLGATKVFASPQQLGDIRNGGLLGDLNRIIISTVLGEGKDTFKGVIDGIDFHFRDAYSGKLSDNFQDSALFLDQPINKYVTLTDNILYAYHEAKKAGLISIVPASALTTDSSKYPHLISLHLLVVAAIHSDRVDNLFPTVVSDENGICLGLAYSSQESLEKALKLGRGVYYSRSRNGLWFKGDQSGDTQELIGIDWDCDADTLRFTVKQKGDGFCHMKTSTCFGPYSGFSQLQKTLQARKASSPPGSYTARLFADPKFLNAKIMEEASELCEATQKEDVAAEAADLLYFALTKCTAAGVTLEDIEHNLDRKSLKVTRRTGNAKQKWMDQVALKNTRQDIKPRSSEGSTEETVKEAASVPKSKQDAAGIIHDRIRMRRYVTTQTDEKTLAEVFQRPSQKSNNEIMQIIRPIVQNVRSKGDAAVLEYTHKFEKATSLKTPVLKAPFPTNLMELPSETVEAIDISFNNIRLFHEAQKESKPLQVETMPGVVCSRFSRPIERVGLYVPGGTAVLPSTAMMLGVPAMVAGCKKIIIASPPRSDGTVSPEIVYVADKVGAESILLAGGAQAVAAMAYGTESIPKVDKILGPGNQFVTAGKMLVANDTMAGLSIDMPAGPSEVLVVADKSANPAFVASDLLSQAEHGTDSQVILIAVDLDEERLTAIEDELHHQANALPRKDIVRGAIEHSITLVAQNIIEAMELSNRYAPEHLILQIDDAESVIDLVQNAGSVFIGHWTPESVGDYSAGVNHSLPTYGYARQYSGVNLGSFMKHITSSNLTRDGLKNVGGAVMQMAKVEELEAHRRAVSIRLENIS